MRVLNALLLSAALALPLAAPAVADNVITVTGEGTVQVTPDMATIALGVTTDGASAAEAMAANSKALQAVIDRLKSAGIEDRDLQTSNLSLNPNWVGYDAGQTPKIAGYVASNMLSVRVRELDKLGSVLDASITDGANTLNGITFDLASPRPVQDEARKAAVADAKARAELLAAAAGVKLGKIEAISEAAGYGAPMPMFRDEKSAAAVPVASGQIGMTASVTITYQIAE
ncbi:SIMPL domain-containing protein [Cypionkella sinensis]|uniref:SIMPL domain-containing protein n=1 Tax=Cypionkella sinensis TaxID=1756043 RepID=A0ABV7IV76_9RHOB